MPTTAPTLLVRAAVSCALALSALLAPAFLSEALAADPGVAALTAEQRATFHGSAEDAPAKELLGIKGFEGRHYLWGDEYNAHLWHPHIKDLGGGYMGVGSDQAYLFIGWQKPALAWLIDYDVLVVDIHAIYRAFFLEAETPEAFLKLWSQTAQGLDRIDHHYASHPRHNFYRQLYKQNRGNITVRLGIVRRRMKETQTPSFLTDAATYGFVREMYKAERIRPMSTNLLEDKGVRGIGAAAAKLGIPMRVVYLSNAEQYWPYSQVFRDNLRSLPFDEKSQIIRTLSTFTINKDYRYNLQSGKLYQAWLAEPRMKHVHQLVKRRKLKGPDDIEFLVTDSDPAQVKPAKKKGN